MNSLMPSAPNEGAKAKLTALRQKGVQVAPANIGAAIDGYSKAISGQLAQSVAENSAHLYFMIDNSPSMAGTPSVIVRELNAFVLRQAKRPYETKISMTLFR